MRLLFNVYDPNLSIPCLSLVFIVSNLSKSVFIRLSVGNSESFNLVDWSRESKTVEISLLRLERVTVVGLS